MEEKELKTSTWQRVVILIIAILMLGSVVAGYVAIVASGSGSSSESGISEEKKAQYEAEYAAKLAEFQEETADEFSTYIDNFGAVSEYDETSANEGGVVTRDFVTGSGRELSEGDTDYLAFYTGWCADASVFDSSLDDTSEPSGFLRALPASTGLISGWTTGVVGMRLGGVRMITIPGEEAYGDTREICGGYNKPLRFLVMAVSNEDPLKTLVSELSTAYTKVQYAAYGIDYDD